MRLEIGQLTTTPRFTESDVELSVAVDFPIALDETSGWDGIKVVTRWIPQPAFVSQRYRDATREPLDFAFVCEVPVAAGSDAAAQLGMIIEDTAEAASDVYFILQQSDQLGHALERAQGYLNLRKLLELRQDSVSAAVRLVDEDGESLGTLGVSLHELDALRQALAAPNVLRPRASQVEAAAEEEAVPSAESAKEARLRGLPVSSDDAKEDEQPSAAKGAPRQRDGVPAWAVSPNAYPSQHYSSTHPRGETIEQFRRYHPEYPYVTSQQAHSALAACASTWLDASTPSPRLPPGSG